MARVRVAARFVLLLYCSTTAAEVSGGRITVPLTSTSKEDTTLLFDGPVIIREVAFVRLRFSATTIVY